MSIMADESGTRQHLQNRVLLEEAEQVWQEQMRREMELDAHGYVGDDDVVAILGDMEDEYSESDHKTLMQAAKDGSKTALAKLADATRGYVPSHKPLSETKYGPLGEVPLDADDLSLIVTDDD